MKNKEIEELLNTFKELINKYSPDTEPFTIDYDYEIKYSALESLLSYIEQPEECYCNRTDCSSRIKDSKKYDSLLQKYEQLEKENETLGEIVNIKDEQLKEMQIQKTDYTTVNILEAKIEQLEKENKILRENAEHNDKVVDKVNWKINILKNNRDKTINNLLKDISMIKTIGMCKQEIIQRLEINVDILKGDSDE